MTVSFELYTLVNGRWQIYVRYEEGRREDAMTEAETLEKESHIERVRVVRDQYDSEMNVSTETVIYETVLAGDDQKKSAKEGKGRDGSSGGDVDLKRKGNKKASESGQDRGADLDALRGKSRELREAAKAIAKKGKRALEIKAQRSLLRFREALGEIDERSRGRTATAPLPWSAGRKDGTAKSLMVSNTQN